MFETRAKRKEEHKDTTNKKQYIFCIYRSHCVSQDFLFFYLSYLKHQKEITIPSRLPFPPYIKPTAHDKSAMSSLLTSGKCFYMLLIELDEIWLAALLSSKEILCGRTWLQPSGCQICSNNY